MLPLGLPALTGNAAAISGGGGSAAFAELGPFGDLAAFPLLSRPELKAAVGAAQRSCAQPWRKPRFLPDQNGVGRAVWLFTSEQLQGSSVRLAKKDELGNKAKKVCSWNYSGFECRVLESAGACGEEEAEASCVLQVLLRW